jgi:hypothetical protein
MARAAVCGTDLTVDLVGRLSGRMPDCDAGGIGNYFAQPGGRHAVRAHVRIRTEHPWSATAA